MGETPGKMDEDEKYYSNPKFEYEPINFTKCHSRMKGDKNDRSSKVWMCAFEPHLVSPEKTTDLIATCGSNSVCVMNVKSGDVITKYYSNNSKEEFYSLSWSTVMMVEKEGGKKIRSNVLAAAGAQCVVHFLHPSRHLCFWEENFKKPKCVHISSLQFHLKARPLLCVAFSDGEVNLLDIGEPSIPDYGMTLRCVKKLSINHEIISLSFSRHCECLLAATDNGVVCWDLNQVKIYDSKSKINEWRINFPTPTGLQSQDKQLVDTVEPIQNGKIVASKCALYGSIYLWDLEEVIDNDRNGGNVIIQPAHILKYSNTDNYFMSMGSSLMSGLLACGDDIGNIWLYDVKEVLAQSLRKQEQSAVIPWPKVEETDPRMVKQSEIVMNKVVVNHNGSYIIGVTSTNLVCIWRKD